MASEGYAGQIIASLRERFRALVRRPEFDDDLQPRKKPTSLVYGVDDNPPLFVRWAAAIQHVFLISVGWLYIVVIVNAVGGTANQAQDLTDLPLETRRDDVQMVSLAPFAQGNLDHFWCSPSSNPI